MMRPDQAGHSQFFNLPKTHHMNEVINIVDDDGEFTRKYPLVSMLKPGSTHQMVQVINLDDDGLISIQEMKNSKGKRKKPCNNVNVLQQLINLVDDDGDDKGKKLKRPNNSQVIDIVDDEDDGSLSLSLSLMSTKETGGQCSRGGGEEFYCTICTETVPFRKRFAVAGCAHAYCVVCVERYATARVEEGAVPVVCPEPGCGAGEVHPEACRYVVRQKVFDRWGAALCERALAHGLIYCPFVDCSAPLLVGDGDAAALTNVECPHCRRAFCARCKVPWHDGVGCAEFRRLGQGELQLRKTARESGWQRCPKCKMYVERVSGCEFITCRCKQNFCYLCGSKTEGHYCKKCNVR